MNTSHIVAVVDPVSTGGIIAAELANRGCSVVAVWSKEASGEMRTHVPELAKNLKYYAEVEEQSTIRETASLLTSATNGALKACLVGCETGVLLADGLAQALDLRGNGDGINRRDKSVQQKLAKAAGLRATREAVGTEWSSVEAFAASESMPVVVKPVESAGSEGVKLCRSVEEAKSHFKTLMGAQLKVGSSGAAVLVQEYLRGKEYVVDNVSRDGVHKTTMVWVYDKRPCNGADFVYYGLVPVPSDSEVAKICIDYTRGVLDALGIKNGPSHGEVMMTPNGPCLVEMNCRAHGGDGVWAPLGRALTGGYSQVDASVDAFIDENAFDALPDVHPSPFKAFGQEVILVCMQGGRVVSTPGFDVIRQLRSFHSLETGITAGSEVERTVDLFGNLGSVFLMHQDPDVMAADLEIIRRMEVQCTLLELELQSKTITKKMGYPEGFEPACNSPVNVLIAPAVFGA
jgi:hypothetical protein